MTDTMPATGGNDERDERTLLGGALLDADTARELLRMVPHPGMIADGRLARAWSALRRVLAAGDPGSLPDAVARNTFEGADRA